MVSMISMFQSLFSWMFFSKMFSGVWLLRRYAGFNPCSLGCFSRSKQPGSPYLERFVSILVLLDVFLEGKRGRYGDIGVSVSILVLLDVFLEDYYGEGTCRKEASFNPCSLGCFSRSRRAKWPAVHPFLVSILVLLDVFLEVWSLSWCPLGHPVFQSLFSWMFFSKGKTAACKARLILFQSLFSWMFFSKKNISHKYRKCSESFNPCSLGCFSRRVQRFSAGRKGFCFNPCSLGCFSRSLPDHIIRCFQILFQSLFSWMFFSKPHCWVHTLPVPRWGFNPCSLGCFSRRAAPAPMRRSRTVSILVLLDVFLEGEIDEQNKKDLQVSILVLLDVFLEGGSRSRQSQGPGCFNPCSLGCFSRSSQNQIGVSSGKVSILVLLDVFLEVERKVIWTRDEKVSILVLLDVFLEVFPKRWRN